MVNTQPIQTRQAENTEQRDDVPYAGQNPYFASEDVDNNRTEGTTDSASVNGSSGRPSGTPSNPSSTQSDDPNYIPNNSDPVAIVEDADVRAKEITDRLIQNGDSLYETTDGFTTLKGGELQALITELEGICNLRLVVVMILEAKDKQVDTMFHAITGMQKPQSGRTSWANGVVKGNQMILQNVARAAQILMEKIQKKNDAELERLRKEAEKETEGFWNQVDDFFTGNRTEAKLKKRREAAKKYKEAMDKSISSLKGMVTMQGVYDDITKEGSDTLKAAMDSSKYVTYTKNGYVDINKLKKWLTDLRAALSGLANRNKVIVGKLSEVQDEIDTMKSAFEMESSSSGIMKAAEQTTEIEAQRTLSLFNQIATETIQKYEYFNQEKFWDYQVKKWESGKVYRGFSVGLKLLSAACSVAACCSPALAWLGLVAIGLSFAARGLDYLGAQHMDEAYDDEYNPTSDTYDNTMAKPKTSNDTIIGKAENADYEMRVLTDKTSDPSILVKNEDGFYSVDYGKIAQLNEEFARLQTTISIIGKKARGNRELLRAIYQAFTGLQGPKQSSLLASAFQLAIDQMGFTFLTNATNLSEVQMGKNWERQQEVDLEIAGTAFKSGTLGQGIGMVIGGVLGGSAGAGVGSQIGGGVFEHSAMYNEYDQYDHTSFDPDNNLKKENTTLTHSSNPLERIDGYASKAYAQIQANGTCNIGNGEWGINPTAFSNGLELIQKAFNTALSVDMRNESIKAQLSSLRSGFGEISVESEGYDDVIKAQFEGFIKTINFLNQLVQERIDVHNRANYYEKLKDAEIAKAIISVVVGFAAGCAAWGGYGNTGIGLMNLTYSLYDAARRYGDSQEDYGDLGYIVDGEAPPKEKDKPAAATPVARTQDGLDESQEDSTKVDKSFIKDGDSGNWEVDKTRIAEAQMGIEGAYMARDAFSQTLKQIAEMQASLKEALWGIQSAESFNVDASVEFMRIIAYTILNIQIQAVQYVVMRQNEMNAAEREKWQSLINSALTAASTVFTALREYDVKVNNERDKLVKTAEENNGKLSTEDQDRLSELNSEIQVSVIPREKSIAWMQFTLFILQASSNYVVGKIYDSVKSKESSDARSKEMQKRAEALRKEGYNLDADRLEMAAQKYQSGGKSLAAIQSETQRSAEAFQMFEAILSPEIVYKVDNIIQTIRTAEIQTQLIEFDKKRMELQNKARMLDSLLKQLGDSKSSYEAELARYKSSQGSTYELKGKLQDYIEQVKKIAEAMNQIYKLSQSARSNREAGLDEKYQINQKDLESVNRVSNIEELNKAIFTLEQSLKSINELDYQLTLKEIIESPDASALVKARIGAFAGLAETVVSESIPKALASSALFERMSEALVSAQKAVNIQEVVWEKLNLNKIDEMEPKDLVKLRDTIKALIRAQAEVKQNAVSARSSLIQTLSGKEINLEALEKAIGSLIQTKVIDDNDAEDLRKALTMAALRQNKKVSLHSDVEVLARAINILNSVDGQSTHTIAACQKAIVQVVKAWAKKTGKKEEEFPKVNEAALPIANALSTNPSSVIAPPKPTAPPRLAQIQDVQPDVQTKAPVQNTSDPVDTATISTSKLKISTGMELEEIQKLSNEDKLRYMKQYGDDIHINQDSSENKMKFKALVLRFSPNDSAWEEQVNSYLASSSAPNTEPEKKPVLQSQNSKLIKVYEIDNGNPIKAAQQAGTAVAAGATASVEAKKEKKTAEPKQDEIELAFVQFDGDSKEINKMKDKLKDKLNILRGIVVEEEKESVEAV